MRLHSRRLETSITILHRTMVLNPPQAEPRPELILFWYAAASADFVTAPLWQSWADRIIVKQEKPSYWLIGLSLSKNPNDLARSAVDADIYPVEFGSRTDDATAGFIWLSFEHGQIELHECLKRLAIAVDGSTSSLEPETFYKILNDLESGRSRDADVMKRASEIIAPHKLVAQNQWTEINAAEPVKP